MTSITRFLGEVRVELGKVTWPTQRELLLYTGVVIGMSLFFALFLGGLDFLFTWIVSTFVTS